MEHNTEITTESIKAYLKEVMSRDAYNNYIDFFEFERIDNKKIVIGYYGDEPIEKFNKEYKDLAWIHICSLVGYSKKIVIYQRKDKEPVPKPVKEKKNFKVAKLFAISMVFACIAVVVAILGCSYVINRDFRESFYSTSSLKLDNKIRVIQISDLHGSKYGENNSKLTERVKKLKPDVIIYSGDIIDSDDASVKVAINLIKELSSVAPSYYIYGNNEVEKVYGIPMTQDALDKKFGFNDNNRDSQKLVELKDSFEEEIEKSGARVLKNESDTIVVGTITVDIYGVLTSNPSSFWSYGGEAFNKYIYENTDNVKITVVHEPTILQEYSVDTWGDLVVCGHTHGGLIKIPIIGPLYTRDGGLLPERNGDFVHGRYNTSGTSIIVSAGIENKNLLRINNQPELVIIDINKF